MLGDELASRGVAVAQEATYLEEAGEFGQAFLYLCSASRILMSSLEVGVAWTDTAMQSRVKDLSREFLLRADKLTRWAKLTAETAPVTRRSHRSARSDPPRAVLVELPSFAPSPTSLVMAGTAGTGDDRDGALARLLVRGILQTPKGAMSAASDVPQTLVGEKGESYEFVDHFPKAFAALRDASHLSWAEYTSSFVSGPLRQLRATGRSGSFFFGTRDMRFIVKSIHEEEHRALQGLTEAYLVHVTSVAASLLVRFYGHFTLQGIGTSPIYVIVMENIFPADRSLISECYDLKGSTYKREASEKEKQRVDNVQLKDLDLVRGPRHEFRLSPGRRALVIDAIMADSLFLEKRGSMDYSLLVGVRKKKQSSPNSTSPKTPLSTADEGHASGCSWPYSPFRCIEGGFASYLGPDAEILHVGIIDFLQPYTVRKRAESTIKSVFVSNRDEISAINPDKYGQRFREFLSQVIVVDPTQVQRRPEVRSSAANTPQ